jgi:hypothetical protein
MISIIVEEEYKIKLINKEKVRDFNPRTNRMKKFKRNRYMITDIPPEKRTFKNLPRDSNKKVKVRFQDWLLIKGEKLSPTSSVDSIGKSAADGKWYGWSHRAVYGFKVGDKVKKNTIGNVRKKEYTIKTDAQAKEAAIRFADDVS